MSDHMECQRCWGQGKIRQHHPACDGGCLRFACRPETDFLECQVCKGTGVETLSAPQTPSKDDRRAIAECPTCLRSLPYHRDGCPDAEPEAVPPALGSAKRERCGAEWGYGDVTGLICTRPKGHPPGHAVSELWLDQDPHGWTSDPVHADNEPTPALGSAALDAWLRGSPANMPRQATVTIRRHPTGLRYGVELLTRKGREGRPDGRLHAKGDHLDEAVAAVVAKLSEEPA